jgi:hypothetical protein
MLARWSVTIEVRDLVWLGSVVVFVWSQEGSRLAMGRVADVMPRTRFL